MIATSKSTGFRNYLGAGALFAALAAAGGLAAIRGGNSGITDTTPPAISQSVSNANLGQPVRSRLVFYVVRNADEEALVNAAEYELQAAYGEGQPVQPHSYAILRADTPEQAANADYVIGTSMAELTEANTTDVDIVDFRNR